MRVGNEILCIKELFKLAEFLVYAYFFVKSEKRNPTSDIVGECMNKKVVPSCFFHEDELKGDVEDFVVRSYLSQYYDPYKVNQIMKGED